MERFIRKTGGLWQPVVVVLATAWLLMAGQLPAAAAGQAAGLAAGPRKPAAAPAPAEKPQQPAPAAPKAEQPEKPADAARTARVGRLIRVDLPLDGQAPARIQQAVDRAMADARRKGARPVLIFEFQVPAAAENVEDSSRGSAFGASLELARFLSSSKVNEATTVAYIPKTIKGHAVLVALACDQIIMAPDATIGSAAIDEETPTPGEGLLSNYKEIANRRKTVPEQLALAMLDKNREVLKVRLRGDQTRYVTPAELQQLKQQQERDIIDSEVVKQAGQWGQFSGSEGRNKLGFVSLLAGDRLEVARKLDLPPEAVQEAAAREGKWVAMRVDLKGPITANRIEQVQRLIDDGVRQNNVNFVCVWLDSPGGDPEASIQLANFLATDARMDPSKVRTVAYIPNEARADAALIALACDQVVMHPKAVLGGPGAYQMSDEKLGQVRDTVRALAAKKMRSWSVWAALLDRHLEVYRCTRLGGQTEFFCEDELNEVAQKEQAGPRQWTKGQAVAAPGAGVKGEQAVEYRLANRTVENFAQFKQHYDLADDPTLIEPGWADTLIEILRQPEVAVLLLVIGFAALYIELHVPGIGIGGFVAAVCFLLFFWSRYGGEVFWLEVLLFVAGIACILLEIFVIPGTGIFGLGGGAMVLASLVLATQTSFLQWPQNEYQMAQMRRSLLMLSCVAGGVVAIAVILRRWLPRAPILGQMFLPPPEGEEAETIHRREMLVDLENLVGARGTTTTQLTPSGKARFGNLLVDVLTDGEFLPRNAPVVVVEVHGNRVLVRAAGAT